MIRYIKSSRNCPFETRLGRFRFVAATTRTSTFAGGEIGADRPHFAAFQKAQEHRLHAQAHFPDFVQEHRAAIAQLKEADLVTMRTGEAALHVTEELRLEERLRHARAIERDKGTLGARGTGMNQSCDEILPDAALSRDEHLRVAGGDTDRR